MKISESVRTRLRLCLSKIFSRKVKPEARWAEGTSTLDDCTRSWSIDEVASLIEQSVNHQSTFDRINSKKLAGLMKLLSASEGRTIIHQGKSKGAGLYLILSGHVAIERAGHGASNSKVIAIAGPGDFFGEMQLMDGRPRSANCIARTDVQLAGLSERQYRDLPRTNPGAALILNSIISRQQTERLRKSTFRSLFLENLLKSSERDINL